MRGLFRLHDRSGLKFMFMLFAKTTTAIITSRLRRMRSVHRSDRYDECRCRIAYPSRRRSCSDRFDGIHGICSFGIFALQPAPVQSAIWAIRVRWVARRSLCLADAVVLPEALQPFFTEHPVYLPDCYQVNDRWQEIAERAFSARCRLPKDGPVFCCFNSLPSWNRSCLRSGPGFSNRSGQRVVVAGLGTGGRRQSAAGGGTSRYRWRAADLCRTPAQGSAFGASPTGRPVPRHPPLQCPHHAAMPCGLGCRC